MSHNKPSPDDIKNQLATYAAEIQEFLRNVNANVEDYKFSIKKSENGMSVDIAFKANVENRN
jgi:hypothetical protein